MSRDTAFLLQAMGVGILIPFFYDWIRIFRRVFCHRPWAISVEDLLFWVLCAWSVFLWMYRVSNGGMRWFAVAGALTGMWIYKRLFSGLLVEFLSGFLRFLLRILGRITGVLLRPVTYLWKRTVVACRIVTGKKRKITGNLKIRLKSYLKALKMRVCKR